MAGFKITKKKNIKSDENKPYQAEVPRKLHLIVKHSKQFCLSVSVYFVSSPNPHCNLESSYGTPDKKRSLGCVLEGGSLLDTQW